jgi:ParB-like chromosome segregation protein Spo0J
MARKNAAGADTEQKTGVLAVAYRPIADLIPYARNARTHSEEQVAQIAASIREFGFTNPVLTDGAGGIIAGHGRVLAAQLLGIEQVPASSFRT